MSSPFSLPRRLHLFDTTLRDGAQTPGVKFRTEDKLRIVRALDDLGIDYIEGGWPGANPTDAELFREKPPLARARFVSFGMTRRAGRTADDDPMLASVLAAPADAYCLFGKTWDYHVTRALETDLDSYLEAIHDSVKRAAAKGEAIFDCEHFFQGYEHNPDYALEAARTAYEAGARWVVLCDTNGIMTPTDIEEPVRAAGKIIPPEALGIHTHNDRGHADSNTWAALCAGCHQAQGTINGLGERCGNANLVTLIGTIALDRKGRFATGIAACDLPKLKPLSQLVADLARRAVPDCAPFIGPDSGVQKAGAHVSAWRKDPALYRSHDPALFGIEEKVAVSNQSGVSNLLPYLETFGIDSNKECPQLRALVATIKQREQDGYDYENSMGSFEVLALDAFGLMPRYFSLSSYRASVERLPANGSPCADERFRLAAQATVEWLDSEGRLALPEVANGNGPINALDAAMRRGLERTYPELKSLSLFDYKQQVMDSHRGTDSVIQVKIVSRSPEGTAFTTVGVSDNSVDASFNALLDSYKLHLRRLRLPPRPCAEPVFTETPPR